PTTVDGLIGALTSAPALQTTEPQSITIDGHRGRWVDVTLAPDWDGTCPDPTTVAAVFLGQAWGDPPWSYGLIPGEKSRLIFLDLGAGDVVMIYVDTGESSKFDELVTQAMPIIESMTFG